MDAHFKQNVSTRKHSKRSKHPIGHIQFPGKNVYQILGPKMFPKTAMKNLGDVGQQEGTILQILYQEKLLKRTPKILGISSLS